MPDISRRKLFGWIGAGTAAAATKVLPVAEKVAPQIPKMWETSWIAGRKYFWDGYKWVKTYSDKYLVK